MSRFVRGSQLYLAAELLIPWLEIPLAAKASAPLVLSSSSVSFGNQDLGGVSLAKSVKVTSSRAAALNFASIAITGNTFGSALVAKGRRTVTKPLSPRQRQAGWRVILPRNHACTGEHPVSGSTVTVRLPLRLSNK